MHGQYIHPWDLQYDIFPTVFKLHHRPAMQCSFPIVHIFEANERYLTRHMLTVISKWNIEKTLGERRTEKKGGSTFLGGGGRLT